jgi:hypothetical protein
MERDVELIRRRGTTNLLLVLAIWGLAVAFAAQDGLYARIPPLFLAAIIALGIIIPVVVYFASEGFRSYIKALGLRSITAFHVWRIAAAAVFFWYGESELLPQIFVQNAGIGDLIAGFFALVVLLLPESRNRYLAFHIFGFADFVVAVGTGLTLFVLNDTRMTGIQTLPMALIPFYGVGISGASHIMAFDLLRRGAGSAEATKAAAGKA